MKSPCLPLFACILTSACWSGCGVPGIPLPPSLNLPQPVTDLRAVRKGNRVHLAWTVPAQTTERRPIRHPGSMDICRSLSDDLKACTSPLGRLPAVSTTAVQPGAKPATRNKAPKGPTADYVDTLPASAFLRPAAEITYAVDCLNDNQRSAGLSNLVKVPGAPTLPPPEAMRAQVTADGVEVSWEAVPNQSLIPGFQYQYRLYRHQQGDATDSLVGTSDLDTSIPPEIVDHDFLWEKTYEYHTVIATLELFPDGSKTQVEGEDSAVVKVRTHNVFPPPVPTGLQAVFSGVGQQPFVDLIWSPAGANDQLTYDVYRREEGGVAGKINSVTIKTTSFRDADVQSGRTYFYSVSAVDAQGNESRRSEEAHESIP